MDTQSDFTSVTLHLCNLAHYIKFYKQTTWMVFVTTISVSTILRIFVYWGIYSNNLAFPFIVISKNMYFSHKILNTNYIIDWCSERTVPQS